jgi:hypothetical protein
MKHFLTASVFAFLLTFSAAATAYGGGDESDKGTASENPEITLHELIQNGDAVLIQVHFETGAVDPFEIQINLPHGLDPQRVKTSKSVGNGTISIVVENTDVVGEEQNGPEAMVSPFVLVGITEDDLSGETPTRLQNLNVAAPDPGSVQTRIDISNPNDEITISAINIGDDMEFGSATNELIAVGQPANTDQTTTTSIGTVQPANAIEASNVRVFPNPSNGLFSVQLDTDSKVDQIVVMSLLGKVVHQDNQPTQKNSIDISNLPVGIYFVEVRNGQSKVVKRIVVDR